MSRYFTYTELRTQVEDAIQRLVEEGVWSDFLEFASNFTTYSPRNTVLIYNQCKGRGIDPSYVAGYKRWRQLGRWVKRGENGLRIVVPVLSKQADSAEHAPLDEDQRGRPFRLVGFKSAYVFDLSQTEGDEFIEPLSPKHLSGPGDQEVEEYLRSRLSSRGFQLVSERLKTGVNGFTDFSRRLVAISDALSDSQRLKTLCHEFAHAMLHETNTVERELAECQAETFAYLVMSSLGIDATQYSIPYLLRWSKGSASAALDGFEDAYELFIAVRSELIATPVLADYPDEAPDSDLCKVLTLV